MGHMEHTTAGTAANTYRARLRGGPDDGALIGVTALPGGAPPDFFHAGPDDSGVYVLAGAPHDDGSLPYWFLSTMPEHDEPEAEGSTWTLISLAVVGGHPKVWHQHGQGTAPVRLRADRMDSTDTPTFVGRAYGCPECGEVTVISLPSGRLDA